MPITLALAHRIAAGVEARAAAARVAVCLCVLDAGRQPVVLQLRMDGADLVSVDLSERKAYTAVALNRPTMDIAEEVAPRWLDVRVRLRRRRSLRRVRAAGSRSVIDGVLAGAIGVSGAPTAMDIEIGEGALADAGLG